MRKGEELRCAGSGGSPAAGAAYYRNRRRKSWLPAASLAAVLVLADAGLAAAQQPLAPGQDKGPIGWEAYRNVDALGQMQNGANSRQFSSYDRTGGNDDGFNGTYSCLREDPQGCVIAERQGAGEISSMWFTRDYGDLTRTGNIRIELDGRTVLHAPLTDVVSGKVGAPFVWPLVGNAADTSAGAVIKVPMPYRESMRVTVDNNPHFYHVNYKDYADANGVPTFNPNDPALDVIERLRRFGVADPKPVSEGRQPPRSSPVELQSGQSQQVARLNGPGRIEQLRMKLPQVTASPQVNDDGRAYGASGGSEFNARVAPDNEGVRITKRADPRVADQRSRLTIDGQPAGEWTTDPAAEGQWGVQSAEVPAERTGGRSSLRIGSEFVGSTKDVNEFRYDVQSKVGGEWVRTDVLDLGPGHPGEEQAHSYSITNQIWEGRRDNRYPSDPGQVAASDAILADARIRITFDGKTTVDAPIGEFFGSGLGAYDVRSLMSSMDVGQDGSYTSWWPMPFREGAQVEIVNGSGEPIRGGEVEVVSSADLSVAPRLQDGSLGYFHATHREGQPPQGQDYNFLTAQGTGVVHGVTHSMHGLIPPNRAQSKGSMPLSNPGTRASNQRNYLEGDERFYVDGQPEPAWHGTGTEDFYESGWYFDFGSTFNMPMAGNPSHEQGADGCQFDCTGAYRTMLSDSLPFRNGARLGIEHGPANDEPVAYGSTTYWYGAGNARPE